MRFTGFVDSLAFARAQDSADTLAGFRGQFCIPSHSQERPCIYMDGNSLGPAPKKARAYVGREFDAWEKLGVEGHWSAERPWLSYHERLTPMMANVVGAKPIEVVVMNSLTVNLHLMLTSFYRPQSVRHKILIEGGTFPSDRYALASRVSQHGYDPAEALLELKPRAGEATLRLEDVLQVIEDNGDEIALVLLGNTNYLTGQALDMQAIASAAHAMGAYVGFDLAHAAGNLRLQLHDSGADFAVWCCYKYLNAGPGSVSGCFVHERHARSYYLPRHAGWWGHNKTTRFQMGPQFDPLPGAEGWQLSNPPIFQLAALLASLEIFEEAGMERLRAKSEQLTGYLEYLLERIPNDFCSVVTPKEYAQRGAQLSIRVKADPKQLVNKLRQRGVICDFREPDIIRAAPIPLYNTFEDVHALAAMLKELALES